MTRERRPISLYGRDDGVRHDDGAVEQRRLGRPVARLSDGDESRTSQGGMRLEAREQTGGDGGRRGDELTEKAGRRLLVGEIGPGEGVESRQIDRDLRRHRRDQHPQVLVGQLKRRSNVLEGQTHAIAELGGRLEAHVDASPLQVELLLDLFGCWPVQVTRPLTPRRIEPEQLSRFSEADVEVVDRAGGLGHPVPVSRHIALHHQIDAIEIVAKVVGGVDVGARLFRCCRHDPRGARAS